MKNRSYTRPTIDLGARYSVHSFSFSGERYSRYCAELNQKLLELEHRVNFQQALKPQATNNSRTPDSREAHIREKMELPTFDESGFDSDFEIDARWI